MSEHGKETDSVSPAYSKELCDLIYSALTPTMMARATANQLLNKIRAHWQAKADAGSLTEEEAELVNYVIRTEEEDDGFMVI
jgi:hypothetical protein